VPPSIVLIIYGLSANVSIAALFTSAFFPGFCLAMLYVGYVLTRAYFQPHLAPIPSEDERIPTAEKLRLLKGLILPLLVVTFVLGSIYGGIASVTEASAVGVAGVMLSTVIRGEFTLRLLRGAALQTLATCGMIVWIGIGASALVGVFNLMGGIDFVSNLFAGMSENPYVVLVFMMAILFVLGMFLWFGVLFCMNMQMSFLSPPFGPAAFYLKSVAPEDISLGDIFKAVLPFIGMQAFMVAMLILFPWLTGRPGLAP